MGAKITVVIAIDFGTRYIGVAIGNTITQQARPLTTVPNFPASPPWPALLTLLKEWRPDLIIIGDPKNMDGSESEISRLADQFATELAQRITTPVTRIDERLSTREARDRMKELSASKQQDKLLLNSVAAQVILEGWLNDNCGTDHKD